MLKKGMVRKLFVLCLLSFCFLPVGTSFAFETRGQDCSKCHTLNMDEARDLLKSLAPNINILDIRVSPLKALWEVFYESGGRKGLAYVDFSKKYLFSGQLISIRERKNLTQESFTALNKIDVSQIPLNDALVLGDAKARLRVIVFTDPD
jgi:thiol:disulfide interchange protein DsbC